MAVHDAAEQSDLFGAECRLLVPDVVSGLIS
jgi:hypothetical protein